MATYPTLPTRDESEAEPIESRLLVRATNGALKVRSLHPSEKHRFALVHDLSDAQRTTLESHYSGDKTSSFAFSHKGTSYTVVYAARPSYRRYASGYSVATVRLEEV